MQTTATDDRRQQIADLEQRLDKGWNLLESGKGDPAEVERWEQAWLRLLRQYEALCGQERTDGGDDA